MPTIPSPFLTRSLRQRKHKGGSLLFDLIPAVSNTNR